MEKRNLKKIKDVKEEGFVIIFNENIINQYLKIKNN